MFLRSLTLLLLLLVLAVPFQTQAQTQDDTASATSTEETATSSQGGSVPGGVSGLKSDADLWRAIRQGESFSVSQPNGQATYLVQSGGQDWMSLRTGPLAQYSLIAIAAIIVLLYLFYLLRGRIPVDHGFSGKKVLRFGFISRFSHWLMAISFILLALSGLNLLFGREYILPLVGADVFSTLTITGKWVHNNVSWAFMLGLVLSFFLWVWHNLPHWSDIVWIAKGGGILVPGAHPPAKKFNFGQKIVFWTVMLLGFSVSLSGLSLLFPFEYPMFAKTFVFLNGLAEDYPILQNLGYYPLETAITPMQDMQYSQTWHTIVGVALIVLIIAHIYIGSIGMKGAFSAMGTGKVDRNWAHEHHSLWVRDLDRKAARDAARTPAE